jgi:3-hydroxybutyrate dehydrogenase
MEALDGRVAVITGAHGGLGRVLVAAFQQAQSLVVSVDLDGDECFRADVSTPEGNQKMIDEAIRRHGRLDILVLNAGRQLVAPIATYPLAAWDALMDLMAKGPFLAIQAAWPHMTRQPGGRIITVGSVLSLAAEAYKPAYVAAKHAVLGLTKVAALEGAPFGLTANTVAPGYMYTAIVEQQVADQMRLRNRTRDEVIASMVGSQPGERFVDPEEVARVILFLASPQSSGITGTCIPVDLGALAI